MIRDIFLKLKKYTVFFFNLSVSQVTIPEIWQGRDSFVHSEQIPLFPAVFLFVLQEPHLSCHCFCHHHHFATEGRGTKGNHHLEFQYIKQTPTSRPENFTVSGQILSEDLYSIRGEPNIQANIQSPVSAYLGQGDSVALVLGDGSGFPM